MWEFATARSASSAAGRKKRVFLARALAQRGRVILLDEPFTGVDVKTEEAIIELLRELRAAGHIMLVSTHNLGSVPGVLRPGRAHQPHRARLRPDVGSLHRSRICQRPSAACCGISGSTQSTVQEHDGRAVTRAHRRRAAAGLRQGRPPRIQGPRGARGDRERARRRTR